MTDSTATGTPIAAPSLELPWEIEEESVELTGLDNGAEMDVVNVTEETTSICESAEFDGVDAVIAAEVVVLNEDVFPAGF